MTKGKFKVHFGKKSIIFTVICLVLIAADLLTKAFKDDWLLILVRDFIEIDGSTPNNPGCAFSFLNEHPEIGQPILITFTFILLAVIITIFLLVPERFTLTKLSLSVISAGAIGNLVDRLAYKSVRDFIGLNMFGKMVYCNLADFFIVIGTILVVIDVLFINDWAVFPLTKSARKAQAERKLREEEKEKKKREENAAANAATVAPVNLEESQKTAEAEAEKPETDDISLQNDEENGKDEDGGSPPESAQ